jgi:hypothetical protein
VSILEQAETMTDDDQVCNDVVLCVRFESNDDVSVYDIGSIICVAAMSTDRVERTRSADTNIAEQIFATNTEIGF